jgi:hypothetical protein
MGGETGMELGDQGPLLPVGLGHLGRPPPELPLDVAGSSPEVAQADPVDVEVVESRLGRHERLGRVRCDRRIERRGVGLGSQYGAIDEGHDEERCTGHVGVGTAGDGFRHAHGTAVIVQRFEDAPFPLDVVGGGQPMADGRST